MTKFHTDEYVDFLTRVTPELVDQMSGHGTRCEPRPHHPHETSDPLTS